MTEVETTHMQTLILVSWSEAVMVVEVSLSGPYG